MPDQSETQRLKAAQQQRAQQEGEEAEQAIDDEERLAHARRADKAAYLRDKLDEQSKAPDE
ncbi:MAG: hypothetical protein M3065_19630 [Actinomycetota bacterium]|nr:hypothetical protein [Actinomycetota bacterium]